MKTTILTSLHERSIAEIELIDACTNRILMYQKIEKEKNVNSMNHYAYTFSELENNIVTLRKIHKRLYTWYLQTLNKIMRYSN